jgi:hypothetical protein
LHRPDWWYNGAEATLCFKRPVAGSFAADAGEGSGFTMTYEQALKYMSRSWLGSKPDWSGSGRCWPAGHSQDTLKFVHVAGTTARLHRRHAGVRLQPPV